VPKAIEAVWKIESTRLIAAIARVTHENRHLQKNWPRTPCSRCPAT
jgi:hypothetical protein